MCGNLQREVQCCASRGQGDATVRLSPESIHLGWTQGHLGVLSNGASSMVSLP